MTARWQLGLAVLLAVTGGPAAAQTISQRVAQAPDGSVHLSFTARPGVCGNGRNISTSRDSDEWESDCESGPVRVALTVQGHQVTGIRTYVGGRWRAATGGVIDLGMVSAPAAADYLLEIAGDVDGEHGRDAVFPATLADSAVVWPRLIEIAKNEHAMRGARRQAIFWLGQAAGEAATRGLSAIVYQDSMDRYLREQAVFALSQRPKDEGVPILIRIARTHPDPGIRKRALFWLGQSEDPRAIALFQELLTK